MVLSKAVTRLPVGRDWREKMFVRLGAFSMLLVLIVDVKTNADDEQPIARMVLVYRNALATGDSEEGAVDLAVNPGDSIEVEGQVVTVGEVSPDPNTAYLRLEVVPELVPSVVNDNEWRASFERIEDQARNRRRDRRANASRIERRKGTHRTSPCRASRGRGRLEPSLVRIRY